MQEDRLKVTSLTDNGKQLDAIYECTFMVE